MKLKVRNPFSRRKHLAVARDALAAKEKGGEEEEVEAKKEEQQPRGSSHNELVIELDSAGSDAIARRSQSEEDDGQKRLGEKLHKGGGQGDKIGRRRRPFFLSTKSSRQDNEDNNGDGNSFGWHKQKRGEDQRKNEQQQKKKGGSPGLSFFSSSSSSFERLAYNLLGGRAPALPEFREAYSQSGISLIFESYISTGFLSAGIVALASFAVSLVAELRLFPRIVSPIIPTIASIILAAIAFGVTISIWLAYPVLRRRTSKAKLESQLAYSFGILGVLAAAGMNLERLFERIASSESNPALADLAKRFLRNVRVFGLDTETAIAEVAAHSPSESFAKMLDSISVAHKTTGSIRDLVMFESQRLLQEKTQKLRKSVGSLAVMAELYITLVVVGPIIFIVMMAIFGLLPSGGLPDPVSIVNLIVFIGIPVLSVMFVLLLDSAVAKT